MSGNASSSATSETPAAASETPQQNESADESLLSQAPDTEEGTEAPEGADKTDSNGDDAAAQTPEKYTVVMPDGVTLDEKLLEVATPVLKELGLSNDAAQKLAAMKVDYDKALAKEAEDRAVAQRKEWVADLKKDPDFANTVKHAQRAVALAGDKADEVRALLNETGLGDHPVIVRWAAAIGARFGEKGFIPNTGPGDKFREKSAAQIIYPDM